MPEGADHEAGVTGRRRGRDLPAPRPNAFYVYAILCDDQSISIGQTDDLRLEWREHLAGQAAEWTRRHRPLCIVHYEEFRTRQAAVEREQWLKSGVGREWLKREIAAGRARQAGYEPASVLLARIAEARQQREPAGRGAGRAMKPRSRRPSR